MEVHEYIKREDALKAVNYAGPRERASLVDVALMVAYTKINSIPAADVVEVVWCKDCKYAKPMSFKGYFMCKRHHKYCRKADDFCSYGERK